MATAPGRTRCVTCDKERATLRCAGCLQDFCFHHLGEHRQQLSKQLDEIEVHRDLFRQTLNEQTIDPNKHLLIQQINKWEQESIQKIKQTAEQIRQMLVKHTNNHIYHIEQKLNKLTNQLRLSREEDDIIETDLQKWKEQLQQMTQQLNKPSNIKIYQHSTTLIYNIQVEFSDKKWKQEGITVAGGNGKGNQLNQFYCHNSIFIDDDQTIYITDFGNHRIVEWKFNATNGQIVAGGNGGGNRTNQLNLPRDMIIDKENNSLIISDWMNRRVMRWSRQNNTTNGQIIIENIDCYGLTMDKNGSLYVSDYKKNEVRRWKRGDQNGTIVAGGNGEGNQLNQLSFPTFIFVDAKDSLYVSDTNNHRVMKWLKDAKEGVIAAGGNGEGNSLTQLSYPRGVIIDQLSQIYVADCDNDRVMRWCKGAKEGTIVVGGNGRGQQSNQSNSPYSLLFDRQGNLYVADSGNNRIQKFEIN